MENQKKKRYLSLPSNYVTLAQLQQRRLEQKNHKEEEKQKQQQQQEEEEPIVAAPRNGTTSPTEDSGTNRCEPEAGAGIGDETADLDTKVAESLKKKKKKKKKGYQKPKPKVDEKAASEEGSKGTIRSEVNEKKSVVDSVKVEEQAEQKFRASSVKGKQNRRMNKVEWKESIVEGSKTAIGTVWNEKKSADDSVKVVEEVEQKFGGLAVNTMKGKQDGRMRRMNQKGGSEEGLKTAIGTVLNEKKSVGDSMKAEKEVEQKFGGLAVNVVKRNRNGRVRRMNPKGASEEGSKTAIVTVLNDKKSVGDSVKAEKEIEQKLGGLTVITVKGNWNGRVRRMNPKGASEGDSKSAIVGSELTEKKSVDSVKTEEHVEQKFGASSVKGNHNWRMRRMNNDGFRHSQSQGDGYGGRNYGYGYGYGGHHPQRLKNDKMVWVRKDGVGNGEIESET